MPKWNKFHIGLAVSIALFFGVGLLIVQPEDPDYPAYVSYSAASDGTKGLSVWWEERDQPVTQWEQSWRFLPEEDEQALFVIQPFSSYPQENEWIMEWVAQGNDLFYFDQSPQFWEGLRSDLVEDHQAEPDLTQVEATYDPLQFETKLDLTPIEAGESTFTAYVQSSYRFAHIDEAEILIEDELGPLAITQPIGEGQVYMYLTPEWLTNEQIVEHDHFELLWPLLQKEYEALWLDEYHHGYQSEPGLFTVYPLWFLVVCLQLIFAVLLFLWWKGKRFGRSHSPREWQVRRGDETLQAIAGWYEKQKLHSASIRHQIRYVQQLMFEKWGVPSQASLESRLDVLQKELSSQRAEDFESVFVRWQQLARADQAQAQRKPKYTSKQFLKDSHVLDEMIKEIEKK